MRISIGLESKVVEIGEDASPPPPPKPIGEDEGGIAGCGVRIAAARGPNRSGVFIGSASIAAAASAFAVVVVDATVELPSKSRSCAVKLLPRCSNDVGRLAVLDRVEGVRVSGGASREEGAGVVIAGVIGTMGEKGGTGGTIGEDSEGTGTGAGRLSGAGG